MIKTLLLLDTWINPPTSFRNWSACEITKQIIKMKYSSWSLFFSASILGDTEAQNLAPALPFSTGFNSSFSLSPAQIKGANLSDTVASSVNTVINFHQSSLANGGPKQDDFYTLSNKPTDLRPGQVLKVQEVTDPEPFSVAPGSSLSRIFLYNS